MLIPIQEGSFRGVFGIEKNLAGTPAMDKLWEYISKSKEEDKIHNNLAGNISKSLHLNDTDDWFFEKILTPLIADYKNEFPAHAKKRISTLTGNEDWSFVLSSFWVNFMKQHEFNPVHHHTGVFSFNIFMKIPYDWREQYELPHIKASNSPGAGNFEFLYTDTSGDIEQYSYRLDPSCEGLMIFFPSEIKHSVYPFYNCEEERITISGNITYDI